MMLVDALVVVLAVTALRLAFRLHHDPDLPWRPFSLKGYSGDGMTHLVMTDAIRRNGGRIPRQSERFLFDRPSDYPMLFHAIHAALPRRVLERVEWLVCPLWEGTHAGLVFVCAAIVARDGFAHPRPDLVGLMTAAGVFLTPLLIREPTRSTVYGERPFGFMAANMALCGVVLFCASGQAGWLVLAAAGATLTLAASKFGVQALVFVSAALALLRLDPTPLLVALAGLAFAIPATGGYGWRVLRGSLRHSAVYRSWIVHVHLYTRGFGADQLAAAGRALAAGRLREAWLALRGHPVASLLWAPWLAPFGWAVFAAPPPDGGALWAWMAAWGGAATLVMAAMLSDRLKFLGEAERYLDYGLFPMAFLSSLAALQGGVAAALWGVAFAGCVARLLASVPTAVMPAPTREMEELTAFLAGLPPCALLTIPGRMCFPIAYHTEHRFLWLLANVPAGDALAAFKELIGPAGEGRYPYISPRRLPDLRTRFGVDLVVTCEPELADAARRYGLRYDFAGWTTLYRNGSYAVLAPPRDIPAPFEYGPVYATDPQRRAAPSAFIPSSIPPTRRQ